jgi:hypothetical protein
MSLNGKPNEAMPEIPPMTLTYDALGNVKSLKGGLQNDPSTQMVQNMFNQGGAQTQMVFFPSRRSVLATNGVSLKMPGFTEEATAKSEL